MKKQVNLFFHFPTSISFPCVKHGKPRTRAGHFERTDGVGLVISLRTLRL